MPTALPYDVAVAAAFRSALKAVAALAALRSTAEITYYHMAGQWHWSYKIYIAHLTGVFVCTAAITVITAMALVLNLPMARRVTRHFTGSLPKALALAALAGAVESLVIFVLFPRAAGVLTTPPSWLPGF